jgi:serine protease Do
MNKFVTSRLSLAILLACTTALLVANLYAADPKESKAPSETKESTQSKDKTKENNTDKPKSANAKEASPAKDKSDSKPAKSEDKSVKTEKTTTPTTSTPVTPVPKATETPISPLLVNSLPKSVADLKAMEHGVHDVLPKMLKATVAVIVGQAAGSGVIIDKEGHVLTAAHVVGTADRDVTFFLQDGTRLRGKTLGANHTSDAGLMQIDTKSLKTELPYMELGNYDKVKIGLWCVSIGHPGGWQRARNPVVRFGRVLTAGTIIDTDCTIMPGDSGGPLFDLQGRVIGINSKIGSSLTANVHVPVSAFQGGDWDRMVKKEVWGNNPNSPYLGIIGDTSVTDKAVILQVNPGSPAEKAGLKPGDIIEKFNKVTAANFDELRTEILKTRPGDEVKLAIVRGTEKLEIKVVVGQKAGF